MFIAGVVQARSAPWKPERLLGSNRLALEEIDYVYLPSNPSDRLFAAVEDLVQVWPGELEQQDAESAVSKRSIVLVQDLRYGMSDSGGFTIRRDRSRVFLYAATDEALANGLYAICREWLGARWYWPGELGFEQVGEGAKKVPERIWRERPAFVQRTLYPVGTDYGRRNRLNGKYSFNHNLARIFTREVFEESPEVFAMIGGERQRPRQSAKYDAQPDFTHPKTVELAAEAAQAHFEANPDANSFSLSINDNSLFDESEETEAVVRGRWPVFGDRFSVFGDRGGLFRENGVDAVQDPLPTQPLNDSTPHMDNSPLREGSINYFRGRPNYTDLVFGFMNEVATRVFDSRDSGFRISDDGGYPDREACPHASGGITNWFSFLNWSACSDHSRTAVGSRPYLTALAYYTTEQSPSFKIHPRVMPVLTADRAQWHDPNYRAEDKALIQRWADSGAERIATWDYYFGAPYPYPRQFNQWIGESIQYLHESGVDVFFSQLPSIWGLDGPKAWLTAELLRDPEQEVEALLDEFYTNFFGSAAGPIREFYEIAEQTRNEREGTANWIKFYKDEAGIELFDAATLVRMRECLDQAEELAEKTYSGGGHAHRGRLPASTPHLKTRFVERVKIVSDAFSYTEFYADYHRSRVRLVELALDVLNEKPNTTGGADLAQALADYKASKASFEDLSQQLAKQPMHRGFSTFNRQLKSDPKSLALAALAKLGYEQDDIAYAEVPSFFSMIDAWYKRGAQFIPVGNNSELQHSGKELRNFLGPEVPVIDYWEIQFRASEGLRIEAVEGAKGEGIRIENADIVSLSQTCPVLGDKTYLLQIEASWQVSPDNRAWVQVNWESISGEDLRTDILLRMPNGSPMGTQMMQFALLAPVNAYDAKVGIVTNRQYEGDYLEIKRVQLGELAPKKR